MERFDPVVAAITGMCTRYQMGCLDLYSIPFEPGMVRDDAPGRTGWAMADQGIADIFPDEAIFCRAFAKPDDAAALTGMPARAGAGGSCGTCACTLA